MANGIVRRGFWASSPINNNYLKKNSFQENYGIFFKILTGSGDGIESLETKKARSCTCHDTGESKWQETTRTGLFTQSRIFNLFWLNVPIMEINYLNKFTIINFFS